MKRLDFYTEHDLHPSVAEAFDQIDAGFFSGDQFHSREALDRAKFYIERWQREFANCEEMIKLIEEDDEEETEEVNPAGRIEDCPICRGFGTPRCDMPWGCDRT